MEYRIKRAKLPERWTLETFPWDQQRASTRQPSSSSPSSTSSAAPRTSSSSATPASARPASPPPSCSRRSKTGYRGIFIKAQDLFDEMYASLADRSSRKLLDRLIRIDLLLIDEMGYLNLRPEQSNIFFKLMEERYRQKVPPSSPPTSTTSEWYDFLGNKEMVAALLDRLRHHCHTIRIDGPPCATPKADPALVTSSPKSRSPPGSFLASTGGSLLASAQGGSPTSDAPRRVAVQKALPGQSITIAIIGAKCGCAPWNAHPR